ncbi:hypothetical protein KFL_006270040 [Klebsormidium nitens]|uniref:Uncharacterized protein n=1 Tax=Klebsormidium nitens TaxID=105231 RepID=A0A1Y1IJM0_KLENI|nr:hypothetical protein KFL_006270040 [Klebsormidium nitens]|eukprot:GAQ90322.1 hypothetical protein KFL_006270040 [Klebsormidium nitens]
MASAPSQAANTGMEPNQSKQTAELRGEAGPEAPAVGDAFGPYNPRVEDEVKATNVVEWCHSQVVAPADWPDKKNKPPWVIPEINPRLGPSKDQAPDPRYWPSMKREYPNPVQASRGENALVPNHFHLAGKVVYFVYWPFFFGELVPIIRCPKCGKVDKVTSDGWTGVSDKIRRVCAADGPAFIYSKVYRCGKGKKEGEGCPANGGKPYQFRSHDEGVLSQLPAAVLEQLPIIFTRGGAIERSLLDTMVRNVATGASVADQQKMVKEAHMRTFAQHKNTYYQYAAARVKLRQEKAGARLFPGLSQQQSSPPADFGEYDDKDGYRGWIPSTSWVSGVILASLNSRLEFLCRHLAAVDGSFWRGDHTFQAPSRIRSGDGRKDYAAVYSIMNEWSQIVGQRAVGDTSFEEYESGLAGVLKRYEDLGYQLPTFMWVDNSRTVGAQLSNAIPSLSRVLEDATHVLRRIFELIPDAHSCKADFCRDYAAAMFKVHHPDKQALRAFLLAGGPGKRKWTKAEVDAKPASYWRARCRHTIPQPEELVAGVEAVMSKYGPAFCAVNGDPLITEEVRAAHERQVQLMREGALSGGNYSPELAGALIALFNYRWNYECAVRSKGAKDWGMFDHWLLDSEMQVVCAAMGWPNPCPEWQRAPPTQEQFGVHAASAAMQAAATYEGDGEQEPEVLDEEAAVLEGILEKQLQRQAQTADGVRSFVAAAAPLQGRPILPPAAPSWSHGVRSAMPTAPMGPHHGQQFQHPGPSSGVTFDPPPPPKYSQPFLPPRTVGMPPAVAPIVPHQHGQPPQPVASAGHTHQWQPSAAVGPGPQHQSTPALGEHARTFRREKLALKRKRTTDSKDLCASLQPSSHRSLEQSHSGGLSYVG